MALENRSFGGAKEIELSPGCTYFENYGQDGVTIRVDTENPGQFLVTMDSTLWTSQASNYVAPDYPPVV